MAIETLFHDVQFCSSRMRLPLRLTAHIIWDSSVFTSEPALFSTSALLRSISHLNLACVTFSARLGSPTVASKI